MKNPVMTITMVGGDKITVELTPEYAPNTVASIISLVQQGMYNGKNFYRVIKDFVLQAGCEFNARDPHGCPYMLPGEYVGAPSFTKYSVGMAGLGASVGLSDGSTFFILTGDAPRLDGAFAYVGVVTEGRDIVDKLNETPCDDTVFDGVKFYQPLENLTMENVSVETFGTTYPQPVTIAPSPEYLASEAELFKLRRE